VPTNKRNREPQMEAEAADDPSEDATDRTTEMLIGQT
jgi:hypothetical protein